MRTYLNAKCRAVVAITVRLIWDSFMLVKLLHVKIPLVS